MTNTSEQTRDNADASRRVMTALGRGIPLTLLCDLFERPSSLSLLEAERDTEPWLERLAYEVRSGREDAQLVG